MLNIVLDLDETLIHTIQVTNGYSQSFERNCDFYFEIENQFYWVIKRPGLDLFLDFIFKYFQIGIWTAGEKEYAKNICKNILTYKQLRKVKFIYSRNFCHFEENPPSFSKPLQKIFQLYPEFNEKNTIMIDNNFNVMKYNQHIGVNVPDFINQYNDGVLYQLRNALIRFYQSNNYNTNANIVANKLNQNIYNEY